MVVNSDLENICELLNKMRDAASPFLVTVDAVSKRGFQMLDLDVEPTPTDDVHSLCVFRLFVKPSNIWKPLSSESKHPKQIHLHWPRAQCTRIRSKFSSLKEGEAAVQRFRNVAEETKKKSPLPRVSNAKIAWIVMPYHGCLVLSKFGQCKIV